MSSALKNYCLPIGRKVSLALALKVSPQVISNWIRRGVPAEHCPAIEKATAGAVRCEDLRPDVDWAYLRTPAESVEEAA